MEYRRLLHMECMKICARLNIVFSSVIFALVLLQVAFVVRLDMEGRDGAASAALVNDMAARYVNNIAFTFIPILLLVNIGREFDYAVVQRSLVSGLRRRDYYVAKLIQLGVFSFFALLQAIIFSLLTALLYEMEIEWDIVRLAMHFVVSFCLGSLSMMIVFVLRRRSYALAVFISYLLLENTLADILPHKPIWLPFQNCKLMLGEGLYSWQELILLVSYTFIFLGISYKVFSKCDLR